MHATFPRASLAGVPVPSVTSHQQPLRPTTQAPNHPRPVVSREQHEGVLVNARVLEFGDDVAYDPVRLCQRIAGTKYAMSMEC